MGICGVGGKRKREGQTSFVSFVCRRGGASCAISQSNQNYEVEEWDSKICPSIHTRSEQAV